LAAVTVVVSLPRNIGAISDFSLLSVGSIVFLVCLLMWTSLVRHGDLLDLPMGQETEDLAASSNACSLIMFSFLCQCNVFPVYAELDRPTVPRIQKLTRRSTLLQIVLYVLTGMCGYASFGDATQDNIFLSLPTDDPWSNAARFLLCISLSIAIPLNIYPTRSTFLSLFLTEMDEMTCSQSESIGRQISPIESTVLVLSQVQASYEALGTSGLSGPFVRQISVGGSSAGRHSPNVSNFSSPQPLLTSFLDTAGARGRLETIDSMGDLQHSSNTSADPVGITSDGQNQDMQVGSKPLEGVSWWVHFSLTLSIVVSTLIVASIVPSISFIMGAIGGIAGVVQMYVLPGIVLLKIHDLRTPIQRFILLGCYSLAAIVGVVSVTLSIF